MRDSGIAIVVICVALAAGCTASDAPGSHAFGGSFTAEATQADVADFSQRMEQKYGAAVAVMESHPMQFLVRGLTQTGCDQARSEAAGLDYIDAVTACDQERTVAANKTVSST